LSIGLEYVFIYRDIVTIQPSTEDRICGKKLCMKAVPNHDNIVLHAL